MIPRIVIGLGNPEKEYHLTRHNIGFELLNKFAIQFDASWQTNKRLLCEYFEHDGIIFAKPTTYMNESGSCVARVMGFYKADLSKLIVIHDDVDLSSGTHKFQFGSGAAGHHGVLDIFAKLGTKDFWRLRIGVGRPEHEKFNVRSHVLSKMSDTEISVINNIPYGFWVKD